jgi:hypothetical protein
MKPIVHEGHAYERVGSMTRNRSTP